MVEPSEEARACASSHVFPSDSGPAIAYRSSLLTHSRGLSGLTMTAIPSKATLSST